MLAVKPSALRDNFKALCDKVALEDETLFVSRPKGENVVVVSEKQYNQMLKAARNAEYLARLEESFQQYEEGKVITKTLAELEEMANG